MELSGCRLFLLLDGGELALLLLQQQSFDLLLDGFDLLLGNVQHVFHLISDLLRVVSKWIILEIYIVLFFAMFELYIELYCLILLFALFGRL